MMENYQEQQTIHVQLIYPPEIMEEPILYRLIMECGVMANIRRANIDPEIGGYLVLKLTGTPEQIESALRFLEGQTIKWTRMENE